MQKYKALNKVWFCLVFLLVCMLMPQAGMAAEVPDESRIIKPFMVAPFGSTLEQIIRAEGYTGIVNYYGIRYEKNFMGMSAQVTYNMRNVTEGKKLLIETDVSFVKADITFADAQQINAEIIDLVKKQMHSPEVILRQYQRPAYEDGRTGEVSVVKAYLKDENVLAALIFWWDDAAKAVKAEFQFIYISEGRDTFNLDLQAIFKPSRSVVNFLANEQEPAYINYNWNMSQEDLNRILGPPSTSHKDCLGFLDYAFSHGYEDSFFGQPATVAATFFKDGFNPTKFAFFSVEFWMSCPTLEQAEAATQKINTFFTAKMPDANGSGYSRIMPPLFGKDTETAQWKGGGNFILPDEHAHVRVKWNEANEQLWVMLLYYKGAMSEEDLKLFSAGVDTEKWRTYDIVKP